jgi:hypothetical protein
MLAVDFDGVIHSYLTPNQPWDPCHIPDPPTEGALSFLRRASDEFEVAIYSSRSHQPGGIRAMQAWLSSHLRSGDRLWYDRLLWPTEKPPARVSIDDRGLMFKGPGQWPAMETLLNFKPWNYHLQRQVIDRRKKEMTS